MKNKSILLLALLSAAIGANAADKIAAGPKGGRLLSATPHALEFFVTKERRAEVTFYDEALKPVAPGAQSVMITIEPKTGRVPVLLEKTPTGFQSTVALPDATEPYRVVVQVRAAEGARPQNFRLDLNLATCGECQRAEYACSCTH